MCEKFHQLLAVGRWFPPGTPGSSTRKLISSSFHRLDMTLAIAEALNPIKPNYKQYCTVLNQILATAEREYYEYRLNKNKGDLAKSWRVLKEIIGLNKG